MEYQWRESYAGCREAVIEIIQWNGKNNVLIMKDCAIYSGISTQNNRKVRWVLDYEY